MLYAAWCIILGFVVGIFGGLLGIGGGILMIPALMFILGFSQQQAQGTTLAMMVPPIGIMAAWVYYKEGYIDLKLAALAALGFALGGYFGAKIAVSVPKVVLQKVFGIFMLIISIKMIVSR